jgi:hypothetical protein
MPADNMSSIGPQADVNSRIAALDAEKARLKLIDAEAKNREKLMKLQSDLSVKEAKVNQGLTLERGREQFFQQAWMNEQQAAIGMERQDDQQAFAAEQGAASRAFQASESQIGREMAVDNREDQQAHMKEMQEELMDAEEAKAARRQQFNVDENKALLEALENNEPLKTDIDEMKGLLAGKTEELTQANENVVRLVEEGGELRAKAIREFDRIIKDNKENEEFRDNLEVAISERLSTYFTGNTVVKEILEYDDETVARHEGTDYGYGAEGRRRIARQIVNAVRAPLREELGDEADEAFDKLEEVMTGIFFTSGGRMGINEQTEESNRWLQSLKDLQGMLGPQVASALMSSISSQLEDQLMAAEDSLPDDDKTSLSAELGISATRGEQKRALQNVLRPIVETFDAIGTKQALVFDLQAINTGLESFRIAAEDKDIGAMRNIMASFEGTALEQAFKESVIPFMENLEAQDEAVDEVGRAQKLLASYKGELERKQSEYEGTLRQDVLKGKIKALEDYIESGGNDEEGSDQGDSRSTQRERTVSGSDSQSGPGPERPAPAFAGTESVGNPTP